MFEESALGSLVERQEGGGTPERNNPRFWNGSVPWASVKDFANDQLVLNSTEDSITQQGLTASSTNLIPAGTPLVCTRMAVGRCAISNSDVSINQDVKALFPKANVSPRYLLRVLDSLKFHAESVSVGSTVKGIRISDLLGIQTPIAPSYDQPKIAQILDTLDTQILKTEALIAKLEKIKEGLLHDLLTRGINENGQLRPTPDQAPELYKESALGLIPKEWEVPTLQELSLNPICYGIVQVGSYFSGGVPVIAIRDLTGDFKTGLHQASPTINKAYPRSQTQPSDILISIKGTVGRIGIVPKHFKGNISRDIAIIRPSSRVFPEYFLHALRSRRGQQVLLRAQVGTTRAELSIAPLKLTRFFLPELQEQELIAQQANSIDQRIENEKRVLNKLIKQKTGLMRDLLTGHVRVTPLLQDAV